MKIFRKILKIASFLVVGLASFVIVVFFFISVAYYTTLWIVFDFSPYFMVADSCLDGGGVWDEEEKKCWHTGDCEDRGGWWSGEEGDCIIE